jgi:hypothetical protein
VGPVRAESHDDDEEDDEIGDASAPVSPAIALAERTLAKAKRQLKAGPGALPTVKIAVLRDADVKRAAEVATRKGRALTGFEPWSRDAERTGYLVTSRGGFELVASRESQACFGNSFLEILTGPRDEAERLATISAVRALCERLAAEDVVSTFCLSPADDAELAGVYLSTGFRRTGVLAQHLRVAGVRKDAIVWSRKLGANAES